MAAGAACTSCGHTAGEFDLPEGRSCFIPGCNHPLVYLGIPLCAMDDRELQDILMVAQNLLVKAQEMKQAEEEEGAQVTGALRR